MERRLYRSRKERMVAGVAGGLGPYLGIDPVFVRLFFILLALTSAGWGLMLYVLLWVVLPEEAPGLDVIDPLTGQPAAGVRYRRLDARERGLLLGGTLVALGLVFLARELGLWWWMGLHRLWPLLLIAAGVVLLIDRTRSPR